MQFQKSRCAILRNSLSRSTISLALNLMARIISLSNFSFPSLNQALTFVLAPPYIRPWVVTASLAPRRVAISRFVNSCCVLCSYLRVTKSRCSDPVPRVLLKWTTQIISRVLKILPFDRSILRVSEMLILRHASFRINGYDGFAISDL
jgi:hypothetical protein